MAKVMIVDDSAYARRVHRGMLEHAGHTVIEAGSGTTAIEMYALERPEVMLLDLSMSDISGVDVLRTVRELDPTARIIVVSADVQRTTEEAVMTGGASRFVRKPASADQLIDAIGDVLRESIA